MTNSLTRTFGIATALTALAFTNPALAQDFGETVSAAIDAIRDARDRNAAPENVKAIYEKASESEDEGCINFCGFYLGMSEADARTLATHYGLKDGQWSISATQETKQVYKMTFTLHGIRRVTKGGNTFDELSQAVANRIGSMKAKHNDDYDLIGYEYKNIDGQTAFISENKGLVLVDGNLARKVAVEEAEAIREADEEVERMIARMEAEQKAAAEAKPKEIERKEAERAEAERRATAERAKASAIEKLAKRYGLELEERDGHNRLSGNFATRAERLRATAEAYALRPEIELDLSDDESFRASAEDALFHLTEGALRVMIATNRFLHIAGTSDSPFTLTKTLESLNSDLPKLRGLDVADVKIVFPPSPMPPSANPDTPAERAEAIQKGSADLDETRQKAGRLSAQRGIDRLQNEK